MNSWSFGQASEGHDARKVASMLNSPYAIPAAVYNCLAVYVP